MPRRALLLLLAALVSWLAAVVFIFWLEPELKLSKAAIERKRAWVRRCDAAYPAKVVVYGGSSCAFSIDGERLEERFRLATVNMGAGAALGPAMLTQLALPAGREGDTLVVALEPGLITRPFTRLMSATHLAYGLGEPGLLEMPGVEPPPRFTRWPGDLLTLRPDAARTCALLGKVAMRQPLYRYRIEEVLPSGYQWTDVRMPVFGPPDQGPGLSADGRALFAFLQRHAAAHRLTLRYSLPWTHSAPEAARARRLQNAALVREIQAFMPVLRDPALGVQTEAALFADTVHHLTRAAARRRTDELGAQLTESLVWDAKSLAEAEGELGR